MHLTTVWLNGEFSASYDSFVIETRPNAKPENVDKKSVLVRRFFCCFSFFIGFYTRCGRQYAGQLPSVLLESASLT